MNPIAAVAWGCEFLLEISGAVLAHRRRLKILAALLTWRAIVDAVTFGIYLFGPETGYRSVTWGARAVQYAVLYALAVQIASKMIADYRPITQQIYKVLAVAGSVAAYIFAMTDVWAQKFAGADAITSLMLLAVVLLGWIGRKKELEEPWKTISIGLGISSVGNSLCALMTAQSSQYFSLYPIPAIAALIIWNWAARPQRKPKHSNDIYAPCDACEDPDGCAVAYRKQWGDFRGEPNQERKPVQSVALEGERMWIN